MLWFLSESSSKGAGTIGSAACSYPPSSLAAMVMTYSPFSKIAICLIRYAPARSSAPTATATLLGGGDLRRIHRQLRGERLGLLPGFLKFPHVAACGRDKGRIDEERLRRRLR